MRAVTVASGLLVLASAVAAEELFLPMVAQKQGQDGAWWNTEVWIANTADNTGGYAAVFLPVGQANPEGLETDPVLTELPPGATAYRNDLIPEGAGGTLRLVTTPGVVVTARVYNSAGKGSSGESLVGMPASAATRPGEVGHLVGLRRTPQYRTNLGVFNPSGETGTVHVRVLSSRGEVLGEDTYRIAPGATLQLFDALHGYGVARGENVRAEVTGTIAFFASASVIDSRSGAPTRVVPQR